MSAPDDLRGLALSVLLPGFDGDTVPAWLADRLGEGLAGVCLFGQNVSADRPLRELTDALHATRPGVLVASDEEGGSVTRLDVHHGSPWPGHATLGALDDEAATYDVGLGLGRAARSAGVDLVLSPVLDVNSERDNPVIGVRSFGADPALVARHGVAFARGLRDAGVLACGKHFPGHGATRTDSHLDLPVLDVDESTWRARDLAPFAAAVRAGVPALMTAHVVVRSLDDQPATTSPRLLGLLREELGFDGVVVTDALDMAAIAEGMGRAAGAVRALAAGADLVCVGNPSFPGHYDAEAVLEELVDAVVRAVADGTLPRERLVEASGRVARLARPRVPVDGHTDASVGTAVARRALDVRGDVRLREPAVLVVPAPELGYAAGRRPSALVSLLADLRPEWPVAEPTALPADGDVLVVVEGRTDRTVTATVRAVLTTRPDAVVVYGGLARPDDPGARTVHTHGTGAATARAAADLLLGGGLR